jgi:hypothetical protein
MSRTPVLLAVAAIVVFAVDTAAQTRVGAAVGTSSQEAGASDLPSLGRGFGGTALGVIATIDRDWRRHIAVGGEVSTAGAISGEQSQRTATASRAFVSRHRDTVVSATAKFVVPIGGHLRAAAVGGAGGAYRHTAREGTTASIFPPASRSPYSESVSNIVFEYTVGADVTFGITDRISIFAAARRHRLRDDDLANGVVQRGVSSTIYRAGIGATWRF